jgi:hypothetical protein
MDRRLVDEAQATDLALDSFVEANPRLFCETTSAIIDSMLPLSGLSPVSGKSVIAKFDGGLLSSDGGVLMLREVEQRLRVAVIWPDGSRTRSDTHISPTTSAFAS